MNHGVRCGPTMFRKQVSRPVDGLDPPIAAAEAEQVERTRRNDLVSGRIRGFCALQDLIHPLACPTPESWRHSRAAFELCSPVLAARFSASPGDDLLHHVALRVRV